jgi:uncharacterized protein (DUF58 family)
MSRPTSPPRALPPRTFSFAGLWAVILGLGMVGIELSQGFILDRLGEAGRYLIVGSGLFFSVWGLKELIAGWYPHLGNRSVARHKVGLPVEGRYYCLIMFVCFVGALLGRSNTLMMVFSLMLGPFIINTWAAFTMLQHLAVERVLPARAMAGESFTVEVHLQNQKNWLSIWMMRVTDLLSSREERMTAAVHFPRVSPGGTGHQRYRCLLTQRGRYDLGPVTVHATFPFGLIERGVILPAHDTLLVYPRIGRLHPKWRRRLMMAQELVTEMRPRSGPFDDDFHKLREYRTGDDPRAIHWKTSARRNELMVREYRESRDRSLVVLLDAWLPAVGTEDDRRRVELGISFAATACLDQLKRSREGGVTLIVSAAILASWTTAGNRRTEPLLDLLALLEPTPKASLERLLVEAAARHSPVGTRTILVTPRPRQAQAALDKMLKENSARSTGLDDLYVIPAEESVLNEFVVW